MRVIIILLLIHSTFTFAQKRVRRGRVPQNEQQQLVEQPSEEKIEKVTKKKKNKKKKNRAKRKVQRWSLQHLYASIGSYTHFVDSIQTNDSGGSSYFEFNPTIGFGLDIYAMKGFRLEPEFKWVLPREAQSSAITVNHFLVRADISKRLLKSNRRWKFRVGTSLFITYIKGEGGIQFLDNGDNSNAPFFLPDQSRSSINNTFDLGIEYNFKKNQSIRLQTYTFALLDSDARQFSYTLMYTYYWYKPKKLKGFF
jgi:hypothetical protein